MSGKDNGKEKPKSNKEPKIPADLKLASKARAFKFKKPNPGPFYAWPMGLWFSLFFIVPIVIIVAYSFMTRDVYGGVQPKFTLKAYGQMFDPAYGKIFLRTLWIAALSSFISIVVALPCGYAMARSRHQTFFLILVVIPFLTNSLIRIFAWQTILGDAGLLNGILRFFWNIGHSFGWTKAAEFVPHKFMFTQGAIVLVSIYMYLPYAILPIFTSVDRFDFSLLEAARDLGATKAQSMFKVLIPEIKSGIISALIFTFIPIFGSYTVPQMVGGKDSYMLGNIIVDQVQKVRNWPLASAFSLVITLISMAAIMWMLVANKKEANLKKVSTKEDVAANTNTPLLAGSEALGGGK